MANIDSRKTALSFVERGNMEGGSYQDSLSHSSMFKKYGPHNFGVRGAQLWSSKLGSHLLNKKFLYMTKGKGNVYTLPMGVDDYKWKLESETENPFIITEQTVEDGVQNGKNGKPFKVRINSGLPHEPVVFKTEDPNVPMAKIIGHPKMISPNSYEYTLVLQTGDPNAWIPSDLLKPGKTLVDATTQVSDELNQKYAGIQFANMSELEGVTGNFARKTEMTDKFIRLELGCRANGTAMPSSASYSIGGERMGGSAVGTGYVYYNEIKNLGNTGKGGKSTPMYAGTFVTTVEAKLEERLHRDVEMNMEFGQVQFTRDFDSERVIKTPAGWRQIVKDGHFKAHNGSLTLTDIYEYISEIFITRKDFADRKIILSSGEAGCNYLHKLIAREASQFQYVDTHFLRSVSSEFHTNALEYGVQFTSIKLPMGYVLQIQHDPIKDDPILFPQKAPGTNYTVESFAMDIFDFGQTDQNAAATNSSNITCVQQGGVEEYFTVSNVYDFETGAIKDGSNARSNNKELGIYRATSSGLCVWDVSRVGRLEYDPAMEVV